MCHKVRGFNASVRFTERLCEHESPVSLCLGESNTPSFQQASEIALFGLSPLDSPLNLQQRGRVSH